MILWMMIGVGATYMLTWAELIRGADPGLGPETSASGRETPWPFASLARNEPPPGSWMHVETRFRDSDSAWWYFPRSFERVLRIYSYGRPWRSLRMSLVEDGKECLWEGAIGVPDLDGGMISLPLRPVWPGFAANVGILGLLGVCIVRGPGALRKYMRRRNGLCDICGYDLCGLPVGAFCPECGHRGPGAGGA